MTRAVEAGGGRHGWRGLGASGRPGGGELGKRRGAITTSEGQWLTALALHCRLHCRAVPLRKFSDSRSRTTQTRAITKIRVRLYKKRVPWCARTSLSRQPATGLPPLRVRAAAPAINHHAPAAARPPASGLPPPTPPQPRPERQLAGAESHESTRDMALPCTLILMIKQFTKSLKYLLFRDKFYHLFGVALHW